MVKLLHAYGMVGSEGSKLRYRKAKQRDVNFIGVEASHLTCDVNRVNLEPKLLVLHGSPIVQYLGTTNVSTMALK